MYDENNIFAKIIKGEIPAKKAYEDNQVIAIYDINPIAPVHILLMPKGKYCSFDDFTQHASNEEVIHFFKVLQQLAAQHNLGDSGYRIVANHGKNASQTIAHFHMHIIGGRPLGAMASHDTVHDQYVG